MGKKAELIIKETLSELKRCLSQEKNMTAKGRIQSLIFIKKEKFQTRQHLADYLCIHIRTLEKWIVLYRLAGINRLTSLERKSNLSKKMTDSMHQELKKNLRAIQLVLMAIKKLLYG